ncbi:MAG: hypothetical protein OZ948_05565 [Deltaproteobacteria bacterium]|nr:hypothetical protein [Deltaproteobacteria bacterium]
MTAGGLEAAFERARAFAAAAREGDPLERARLAQLLGEAPPEALLAVLPAADTPAAALRALALLAEAGALDRSAADPAVRAIEAAQRSDGAFAAGGAGEQAALVTTGIAAGLLARSAFARPAPLRRAGAWLSARWAPERVKDGDFGRLAAYAGWLANANPEIADAALQWCGREWERGFRSGRLGAAQAARVLLLADAPTLPGARLAPGEIAPALLAAQEGDGGWPAAGGGDRVAATAEALAALRHLARWRRP